MPPQLRLDEATPGYCWDTDCTWELCCDLVDGRHGHVYIRAPHADDAVTMAPMLFPRAIARIRGCRHLGGRPGMTVERRRRPGP